MKDPKTNRTKGMRIRELFDRRKISVFDYATGERIEKIKKQSEITDKQDVSDNLTQTKLKF